MSDLPAPMAPATSRLLTAAAFQSLAAVPSEIERFVHLVNAARRRAYENATADFMRFTGIARVEESAPSRARTSPSGATT